MALIDFDRADPGPRMWEIAYSLLGDNLSDADFHLDEADFYGHFPFLVCSYNVGL